jgi:hypothetical protein
VHYPKNLRAAASSSYILGLGGGLCNWRLFSRRPPNERRYKKIEAIFRKANKIQCRRSRIPIPKLRSVFEKTEDLLNYHPKWRVWGSLKTRAQPHGELIFGRVAVRYRREPIMLLYSLWSTASPSSSGPSDAVDLIRVDTGLSSAIWNFFIRSFVYLAWCTNVPCFISFTWIPKKKVSSPIIDI